MLLATCLLLAGVGTLATSRVALAAANNVPVTSVSVQRLDATVTKTTIVTAFATAHDIVEVYNYVPVQASADWRLATSMDDAAWLFKPGGGAPKLAIFFTTEGGLHMARLYDDQLAEGAVPMTIKSNHVVLDQPLHWTLQAQTKQPWLLPDGRPATDIVIQGAFALPHEDDALGFLAHRWHGHDAWDFHMVDPTGGGVPSYALMQLHPQGAPTADVPHTLLDLNVAGYHVTPFANAIFWPYLGSQDVGLRAWFDHRPPLSMNWTTGQLRDFGSVIPDLEPENGVQIFSNTAILDTKVNDLDFENPFTYYRFDPGHTGFPNLIIRNYFSPPGDQYGHGGGKTQPAEFVRYSWGDGNGLIQYKLGLLGRYDANATLHLGDFTIRTMDYPTLPSWVVSRTWDFETFVASETGGFRSSEGIYDWDYVSGDFSWVSGDTSSLPLDAYSTIAPGMRGEYRVLPTTPPQLYVSAIDQRLHLLGAQRGVWAVDPHQTIATASLDGQTIGQWIRSVDGVSDEAFYAVPGARLYADRNAVTLQPARALPAPVLLAPPTDEASLNALRLALPANPPAVMQDGLRALLIPADAAQLEVLGAALSNVRLVAGGWRAELQVPAAADLAIGPDVPPALLQAFAAALGCPSAHAAGRNQVLACRPSAGSRRYVVHYDGSWTVQAATAPDLKILAMQAGSGRPALAEIPVTITVGNSGGSDATGRLLQIYAQRSGYPRVDIARLAVDVPAGEQRQYALSWLPSSPGQWTVGAVLDAPTDAAGTVEAPVLAGITLPAPSTPAWYSLGPVPSRRLIAGAFGLLVSLGVLTAATVWAILR